MNQSEAANKPPKTIPTKVIFSGKASTSSAKIICPACEMEYTDPPEEDWIQCHVCEEWWHEACSSYEGGGKFTCDYC